MTINDSVISEQGMCEEEQVARIAWFYYHDGLTQSEISDRLGLTRLKVSRLLEKGHQSGIIRVPPVTGNLHCWIWPDCGPILSGFTR